MRAKEGKSGFGSFGGAMTDWSCPVWSCPVWSWAVDGVGPKAPGSAPSGRKNLGKKLIQNIEFGYVKGKVQNMITSTGVPRSVGSKLISKAEGRCSTFLANVLIFFVL